MAELLQRHRDAIQILENAIQSYESGDIGWCQEYSALDDNMKPCLYMSHNVAHTCAIGELARHSLLLGGRSDGSHIAESAVRSCLEIEGLGKGLNSIPRWNDGIEFKDARDGARQVAAMFRKAINYIKENAYIG